MGSYSLGAAKTERKGSRRHKPCRRCDEDFKPASPSQLYCSDQCAADGKTSAYLKRVYGITLDDYERMHYEQSGLCAICGSEGFLMKECHSIKLVVDHCHATGKVRGLLCHNCNRALGLLKDNVPNLQAAINYLRSS